MLTPPFGVVQLALRMEDGPTRLHNGVDITPIRVSGSSLLDSSRSFAQAGFGPCWHCQAATSAAQRTLTSVGSEMLYAVPCCASTAGNISIFCAESDASPQITDRPSVSFSSMS